MDLQPRERVVLYDTYLKLAAAGSELPTLFYTHLFEQKPAFQKLFKVSMRDQGVKWRLMLNLIVSAIDQPSHLKKTLRDLGRRHIGYGVKPEDYGPFTDSVLWAIRQYLGAEYTAEVDAAWRRLFEIIVDQATKS